MIQTPGFNPENGFREIGKSDFFGAFYLANSFKNQSLRAMTTLSLVDLCLQENPPAPEKVKTNKRAPAPNKQH
jgi:hypothetical protein